MYPLYLTPHKLHMIYPMAPDRFWKGCGGEGTLLHCLWSCPKIQELWEAVVKPIELINQKLLLKQHILSWHGSNINPLLKYLRDLLLCVARSLLTANWKNGETPQIWEWYLKIWDFFLFDKISVSLLLADNSPVPKNFQEKWLPLLEVALSSRIDCSLFQHHERHGSSSYFWVTCSSWYGYQCIFWNKTI